MKRSTQFIALVLVTFASASVRAESTTIFAQSPKVATMVASLGSMIKGAASRVKTVTTSGFNTSFKAVKGHPYKTVIAVATTMCVATGLYKAYKAYKAKNK